MALGRAPGAATTGPSTYRGVVSLSLMCGGSAAAIDAAYGRGAQRVANLCLPDGGCHRLRRMARSISDSSCSSATPKFSVMTKPDLTDDDYLELAYGGAINKAYAWSIRDSVYARLPVLSPSFIAAGT